MLDLGTIRLRVKACSDPAIICDELGVPSRERCELAQADWHNDNANKRERAATGHPRTSSRISGKRFTGTYAAHPQCLQYFSIVAGEYVGFCLNQCVQLLVGWVQCLENARGRHATCKIGYKVNPNIRPG